MKRSRPYHAIRTRVVAAYPNDSWCADGLAFFTFALRPALEMPVAAASMPPQAIFALVAASGDLLAARVIEPGAAIGEALVNDLLAQAAT